jgi:ArsR family transcriptional regulator, arsenate/arsenite/antimonite-responsive transcriptional repressor
MTPHELFSLLSDETRLRCLVLLSVEKELCVCELGKILESIQPKVSRHLSLLRKSGLVFDERRGQWVYYRLNRNLESWVEKILTGVLSELKKCEPYASDFKHLAKLRKSCPC